MVLRIEDLELDRVEHRVKRGGRTIELTPKEFSLLEYLMRNAGQPMTRTQIIEHVWNLSFDTMTNVVDVYINYLRKKVDRFRTANSSTRSAASATSFREMKTRQRAFPLNGAPHEPHEAVRAFQHSKATSRGRGAAYPTASPHSQPAKNER